MHLKGHLERVVNQLTELEGHARKLQNQNFADIVKAAHSRVTQLTQHPDIDAVHGLLEAEYGEAHSVQHGEAKADEAQSISGAAHGGQSGAPFPT